MVNHGDRTIIHGDVRILPLPNNGESEDVVFLIHAKRSTWEAVADVLGDQEGRIGNRVFQPYMALSEALGNNV